MIECYTHLIGSGGLLWILIVPFPQQTREPDANTSVSFQLPNTCPVHGRLGEVGAFHLPNLLGRKRPNNRVTLHYSLKQNLGGVYWFLYKNLGVYTNISIQKSGEYILISSQKLDPRVKIDVVQNILTVKNRNAKTNQTILFYSQLSHDVNF